MLIWVVPDRVLCQPHTRGEANDLDNLKDAVNDGAGPASESAAFAWWTRDVGLSPLADPAKTDAMPILAISFDGDERPT